MNAIEFMGRLCLSFGIASIISLVVSFIVLGVCWLVVYLFKLNDGADAYWAVSASLVSLYVSWIVGFAYFIRIIK